MKKWAIIIWVQIALGTPWVGAQQENDAIDPLLQVERSSPIQTNASSVVAVYGHDSTDYLPVTEIARKQLRLERRKRSVHPSFDMPDVFYFVGGPIIILVLLRILIIFLNEFEDKRKEEMRAVASEELPDRNLSAD